MSNEQPVSLDEVESTVLAAADAEFRLEDDGAALQAAVLSELPAPEKGAGGELVPPVEDRAASVLRNTLDRPNYVAAHASRARLNMAHKAGSLTLALDMAETVGAENSAEKLLAHQMAAAHAGAMNLMAQMQELMRSQLMVSDEGINIRGTRLAGAAARLMASYQQGLLTLQKLRTGGRQQVIVQHQYNTNVQDSGQAMIAPKVKARGRGRKTAKRTGE